MHEPALRPRLSQLLRAKLRARVHLAWWRADALRRLREQSGRVRPMRPMPPPSATGANGKTLRR